MTLITAQKPFTEVHLILRRSILFNSLPIVPEGWLTRCLVFARGGHIVHVAHEKEIVDQIENVLEYVERAKH